MEWCSVASREGIWTECATGNLKQYPKTVLKHWKYIPKTFTSGSGYRPLKQDKMTSHSITTAKYLRKIKYTWCVWCSGTRNRPVNKKCQVECPTGVPNAPTGGLWIPKRVSQLARLVSYKPYIHVPIYTLYTYWFGLYFASRTTAIAWFCDKLTLNTESQMIFSQFLTQINIKLGNCMTKTIPDYSNL